MTITDQCLEDTPVAVSPDVPPERLLHRTEDAARVLGIGRTTIYALIKEGALRPVYIGRSCRLSHAELVRYVTALDEMATQSESAAPPPRSVRPYRRRSPHTPASRPA